MTDLTKGIIEIDGFEITPETTQTDFERTFQNNVYKRTNRFNSSIVTFQHPIRFRLNSLLFIHLEIDFVDDKISKIALTSDLQNYGVDENGKKTYSPEKEVECYNSMFQWASKVYGTPNLKNFGCWNYVWGSLNISKGDYSNRFFIEYGRNYSL